VSSADRNAAQLNSEDTLAATSGTNNTTNTTAISRDELLRLFILKLDEEANYFQVQASPEEELCDCQKCQVNLFFLLLLVKFMFSKKATFIEEIFTVDLTVCSKCQIDGEDFVKIS
jgi:hypothetical protein